MRFNTKTAIKIGISIFFLFLCVRYWSAVEWLIVAALGAAAPLIIGCAIAYVVNILMKLYEKIYFSKSKKKFIKVTRRPLCLAFAFLTIIALVVLIILLIVPQLVSCIELILAELPGVIRNFIGWLEEWNILPEDIIAFLESIDWKSKLSEIAGVLISGIGNVAGVVVNLLSSVFDGIITAFIAIIFSIYLLSSKETLKNQCLRVMNRYIPKKANDNIIHILTTANGCFSKYIIGQCTEAVILGALCVVGMLIINLPYAPMIGSLIAFTALIPIAGAYIGGAVGAIMIFTVSPIKALVFIIFLLILQQIEGNLIYPKVVGSSMGLPGIWVLAAITIGGGLAGVMGMLISVPIVATAYRLLKENLNTPKKIKVSARKISAKKKDGTQKQ